MMPTPQGPDTAPSASASKQYTLLGADRKPYLSPTPGQFGGHRKSRIFGRMDCRAALRAIAAGGYVQHRVFFADEETALAAGFRPCAVCMPKQYRSQVGTSLNQNRPAAEARDQRASPH